MHRDTAGEERMPEWTAEVIWSLSGAAIVALLIGWLIGRFGGG